MSRSLTATHEPGQMSVVDRTAVTSLQFGMRGDLPSAVVDAHHRSAHGDPHPLTDQPPGYRVSVAVDRNRAVRSDPAHEIARGGKRRHARERP